MLTRTKRHLPPTPPALQTSTPTLGGYLANALKTRVPSVMALALCATFSITTQAAEALVPVVTPGSWVLYRGTQMLTSHPTADSCAQAAVALGVARTYSCKTTTKVVITQPSTPVPVNCVVSAWSVWAPGPVGFETRTRTVLTAPANGGTACPALSETRSVSQVPAPTFTLSTYNYVGDGYATAIWSGVAPCTASAVPAYEPWLGTVAASGGKSVSPDVTTVMTLTCANGAVSRTLTVTGNDTPPPTGGGGGGSGGGGNEPPPTLPTVTPLPTPLLRSLSLLSTNAIDAGVLNFAHTANREWNFGGHIVDSNFDEGQGNWDYNRASSYHAWLFDRPSSWFKLYALSNNPLHRDYAIRDTAWYASQINSAGYFIPKVNAGEEDTKYGYVTPFLLYERVTGDTQYRAVAQRVYQASLTGFSNTYSATGGLWTEREAGLHGEAALAYYELTGEQYALNRAGAIVRQVGALAAANDGAPQVSYTQHEGGGPGGTTPTSLTNSPWMMGFYFQFARRYYEITGDQAVLQQASAYFDWLDVNGLYDGSLFHPEFTGVTVPRYLTGALIGDAGYDEGNMQHCLDVAGVVSFAVEAKARLGLATARAQQRLAELKICAERNFGNWTRTTTTLPKYRMQAPRIWMWWIRGRFELQ
jgi:hypothetical protein